MKKIHLILAVICVGITVNAQPPKVPADKGAKFGEAATLTADNALTVEQLADLVKAHPGSLKVKLKGKVTEVCQAEGCWIKIQSPDGNMMVKMKDHKFTVPVILNGKNIVIEGFAESKLTTLEQLRHFAEDAGKSKAEIAKITEPKKELIVQANGILVL